VSRFRCEVCDYVYDEARGEPREGFPAGTPWHDVPDDWCCPDCGVREKLDFVAVEAGAGGSPRAAESA
jgi:rubredoxin